MSLAFLVFVAAWLLLGLWAGAIAAGRGRRRGRWTLFGLLLGPLALLVALLAPRPKTKCPYCAEYVLKEAIVCRFCHHPLIDDSDVLFRQWLSEQQVEIDELPEEGIAEYRAAFEKLHEAAAH